MLSLLTLNVLAVVIGLLMLLRNVPRAIAAMRSGSGLGTNGAVALVNVVLAVAIIVTAAVSHFGAGSGR